MWKVLLNEIQLQQVQSKTIEEYVCPSLSSSLLLSKAYIYTISILLGVLSKRTCSAQSRERAHSRELSSGKHFSSELTVDVKIFVCYININSLEKINLNK